MRKHLSVGTALALVAIIGVSCAPTTPPVDEPPLPVAPLMNFPPPLPDGTIALVFHTGPDAVDGLGDVVAVDARGARRLVEPGEPGDRELVGRALGHVAPDGSTLRSDATSPGLGDQLFMCPSHDAATDDCEVVPLDGRPSLHHFSPDGSRFAVTTDGPDDHDTTLQIIDSASLELVVSAATAEISTQIHPAWRSDSGAIAITTRSPGGGLFDVAVATLEAAPGAVPQVVVAPTTEAGATKAIGWADDGTIQYEWYDRSLPPLDRTSLWSVAADGSSAPTVIGSSILPDLTFGLRDGSVLGSRWLPGGGSVVQLQRAGGPPVALSQVDTWTVDGEPRQSQTQLIGIVEPR